ncbi:MAG: hypothetical protein V2B15_02240 [Bacteroidota bacterium]
MAKLKESIGKRMLKRKRKGFIRDVRVHNFETAKSAVVLFEANVTESFQVIKDFRKFLESKGIRCNVYGYVSQKEVPQEMLFWKNYAFITRSNLNWYMKPSGENVEAFFADDPDILIDFTRDIRLELQFLVQLSTARFKIGCFTETENDYDLMINLTDQNDIGFLAEQFKHYIGMLNPVNQ